MWLIINRESERNRMKPKRTWKVVIKEVIWGERKQGQT